MTNPFVLEKQCYKREIDPIGQYVDQASNYLSLMSGQDINNCKQYVQNILKNKLLPGIVDPKVVYLEREDNGDRVSKETTLSSYLNDSLKNNQLIAPTLTTYLNPIEKESLLVSYVEDNVAARGRAKKASFAAEAAKEMVLAAIKNIEQTNKKLSNNAVSGAMVSASTPLYCKTGHSTLTSTCRSTSGYGNANNEKFLSGNRHYWSFELILSNIVSIITHTDYNQLNVVMNKYQLTVPSVSDVMKVITYSSDLYWKNPKFIKIVEDLVLKLTSEQRAAFVYTGDMFHLMLFNQNLIKDFLQCLSSKKTGTHADPMKVIKGAHEDNLNLAHQICSAEMKGKGKNYKDMEGSIELQTLALTVENIVKVITDYSDLIRALWVTDNMPASVAYFPESIRRSALTSDTDSTIFTVQDWVLWYKGNIGFDEDSMAIAATMIFLTSQTITHILAKMSVNLGITPKRIHQIAMKNEFKFDVFVPTQVAKHYYAIISCQEGNVFDKLKKEIKGVHLKSSNAPLKITKKATELMESIMMSVLEGKKIKILDVLKDLGDVEREITKSIKSGELDYFRLGQIKTPDSYTTDERQSPYGYHLFWEEVFAPTYGSIAPPPYSCIKVSTTLNNPTATMNWLTSIEDYELGKRAMEWFARNNKKVLPTMLLSLEVVKAKGLPKEIVSIIDSRRMVSDITGIFSIILETLGIYIVDDRRLKMISDFY